MRTYEVQIWADFETVEEWKAFYKAVAEHAHDLGATSSAGAPVEPTAYSEEGRVYTAEELSLE